MFLNRRHPLKVKRQSSASQSHVNHKTTRVGFSFDRREAADRLKQAMMV
jgi:hypothetical protein